MYGENWLAVQRQMAETRKPRLKVDKATKKKIEAEIRVLQDLRDSYYDDDNIDDDELSKLVAPLQRKIDELIYSQYETKTQIEQRLRKP